MSFVPTNAVVWFEIPTTDLRRARTFYETVTGMSLREDDSGPNPMVLFPAQDDKTGVAGHLYPGQPAKDGGGNTIHLAVEGQLEDALRRVPEVGGKVTSDIIKIPPGRFAYCQDPDGNSIGLFTFS
ncbi:MAG: VOC family protein [Myxococcales bacterium]|nr:VOC family protein [Myxococcales bacterium]MDD9969351.1 VOC family protein [Myxococcales bacterium]